MGKDENISKENSQLVDVTRSIRLSSSSTFPCAVVEEACQPEISKYILISFTIV